MSYKDDLEWHKREIELKDEIKDTIKGFITTDITKRYNHEKIKITSWFSSVNWEDIKSHKNLVS